MSMSHNFENLKDHILPLSWSPVFETARLEWDLVYIEISEEFDQCPCSQEIKEHCYIRNRLTGHQTYVGNVCINKFLGIPTTNLFEGLRRIKGDLNAAPNEALIDHAHLCGYLHENELGFLRNTARKRTLSDKQLAWRQKINRRILLQLVVKRRGDAKPQLSDA